MKTNMGPVRVEMATVKLDDWGIPEQSIVAGKPHATGKLLHGDGQRETGVWECTPGTFDWDYDTHQSLLVVSGRAEVTVGRRRYPLGPGTAIFFPAGTHARWKVTRTLRKLYVLY